MTMGLVERGSEGVIDQLAGALAKQNKVLVIQSGKITKKDYMVKRVHPLVAPPSPSPKNIIDKFLFRLHLDDESGHVAEFTKTSLPVLTQFDPDIVIAVNGSLQVRISKEQIEAKIVTFGHAGIGYHDRHTIESRPDLFVALTPASDTWATKIADKSTKVVYIPNPIDLSEYKHPKKVQLKLDRPIVMTASALSQYKNVLNVVSAIKQTPTSYLLVGDGEQSHELAKVFSTIGNSFLWIKHLEQSAMPSYFVSSDVFCFTPDAQEAFGMVYLEAMAAGLPIVASDDPIRRDIIGDQGIYVDPHDVDDIARGIGEAIQLDRIDYSKELKRYDLRSITKTLEKEFHDLIK